MSGGQTGADRICAALQEQGVDLLFGYPGGAIMPLYDALCRRPAMRHVLVRHEQAAAHAADGYARATGRVGVCVTTSGPGATNLVTGLATAAMDGVPLVALTGQVATGLMGSDAFQEADILGITMPVTKHGFVLATPDEIEDVIHEAFRLARTGRPGPVLVDIPKDVQLAIQQAHAGGELRALPVPDGWRLRYPGGSGYSPNGGPADQAGVLTPAADQALERAVPLLNLARRPLVVAGRGVVQSGTAPLLLQLAERNRLPVVTTLLGLDAFPRSHPLALGMPGMHGTPVANQALQQADVVFGFGLRFDDRVTGPLASFARDAEIVLFEVDGAVVGRTVCPTVKVLGDLRNTLPALVQRVRREPSDAWWAGLATGSHDRAGGARGGEPSAEDVAPGAEPRETVAGGNGKLAATPDSPLTGRDAARLVAHAIEAGAAQLAIDVGQHQMWMAQELLAASPGSFMTPGGLGTMGYALPAAVGAALGRPDRATWAVIGDGGFQMSLAELATVVQEQLPLRIVILNNGHLGMVRQWQELFFQGRVTACRLSGPDLTMLARAYGVPARAVERHSELATALEWAAAVPGPVLLEIRIACEDNVYPILPPGAALDELLHEPELVRTGRRP